MALARTQGNSPVSAYNTDQVRAKFARCGFDPIERGIRFAMNDMPCPDCQHTNGKARYTLPKAQRGPCPCIDEDPENPITNQNCWKCEGTGVRFMADRTCRKCHGHRRAVVPLALQQQATFELLGYAAQKLKQVEVSGTINHELNGLVERLAAGRARAAGLTVLPAPTALIEAVVEDDDDDAD